MTDDGLLPEDAAADSNGAADEQKKKKDKPPAHGQKHTHAGGSGAVLGARIARYTLWQGSSLFISNLLHAASIVYVAHQLGAASLGTYSLLLFWSGLITQVFHIFSKPGTLRRVFGQADDEDAGAEGDFGDEDGKEDDDQAARPERSLGVGIIWVAFLGILGGTVTILLRRQIAGSLLGNPDDAILVFWAGILGGVGAIFKLCDIVIWFEKRPLTFVLVDGLRPALNLILMAYWIHQGDGVEGAIRGAAIGTSIATVVSVLALVRSFTLSWDWTELKLILLRGLGRVPIAMSMWTIQNADSFILSKYVGHKDLGYYKLAQTLGYVVTFLPQGFRIAMRPLRRSAVFEAVKRQYGAPVAQAQLLFYFMLLGIIAVLAMIMGGDLIVNQASSRFEAARPLIPFTAAALTMPSLLRTINGQTIFAHKRPWFIASAIWAAVSFVGLMMILVPAFGIIGTPLAMLGAFGSSCAFLWIRGQRGPKPLEFPYVSLVGAIALAAVVAVFFRYIHFGNKWLQLGEIAVLMSLYLFGLFATRIIPTYHRAPIWHIVRSALARRPHGFDRDQGLSVLKPRQLDLLHDAIVNRIPPDNFGGEEVVMANNGNGNSSKDAVVASSETAVAPERLVKILRKVGNKGGVPVGEQTEYDARIAKFLFADSPTATRNATMRGLISAGAESNDLRVLEDLVEYLAKSPKEVWKAK